MPIRLIYLLFLALIASTACSDPAADGGCESAADCETGEVCRVNACVTPPRCVDDGQCEAGTVCQAGGCLAVPCAHAGECGAGRICAGGACAPAPANPCETDADCPGALCDRGTGQCGLPLAPCDAGACPEGERCAGDLCRPAEICGADGECPAGAWCTPADRCANGCRIDPDDCLAPARCHVETRACVEGGCATDADCEVAEYCDAADGCQPGCRTGPDSCPGGTTCDPERRACTCGADDDCPAEAFCDGESLCREGCRLGGDGCPEFAECDPETRGCTCLEDAGCPPDAWCDAGACREGCRPGGCPDGQACDLDSRQCAVPEGACDRDLDCPLPQYCAEAGCTPGCREGGCPDGQACDLVGRACRCAVDAGCEPGEYCEGGRCLEGCSLDGAGCATGMCDAATRRCECEVDGQCRGGQFCGEGLCTPGCRLNPDDCDVGRCDPATHQCDAGACGRDADCPNEQACLLSIVDGEPALRCGPALAEGGAETPCEVDVQCASRLCLGEGHCFSPCERDADCPSRCVTVNIRVDEGDPVEFQTCAPPQVACVADVDCGEGRVCGLAGDDPAGPSPRPLLACRPLGDRQPAGSPCMRGGECGSGLCYDRRCWAPCTPAIAEHCPQGEQCYPNQFHLTDDRGTPIVADDLYWGMPACVPEQGTDSPCNDGACPPGEVCTVRNNQRNDGYDRVCRTPVGGTQAGGICRDGATCQSGICIGNNICLGVCGAGNPDACAPGTRCQQLDLVVSDRGTPGDPADDLTAAVPLCAP